MKTQISIIVAVAENGVIGKDNRLIWHLPADLKHFKELTMGKPIIMGRKTFESIGKPLPGRQSIVISRDAQFQAEGCKVVDSLEKAIEVASFADEMFIIGGASIYEIAQKIADKIYLTEIHQSFDGDVFFKINNPESWEAISQQAFSKDEKNPYNYSFIEYVRKKNLVITDYYENINSAVTICDREGTIVYMNRKAKLTFLKYGGADLIGRSLFDCHNENSVKKIRELLETGNTNAYTIEKNGQKKLIYQTPWFDNGKIAGLIEFSHVIPFDMPHFVR